MSILMTLRVAADRIEATGPEVLQKVIDRAKEYGAISHHFYGSEKEVLVVDEWPDEPSGWASVDG